MEWGAVTRGFSQSAEFRTPDNGTTKEERLQLVRCAMLDSQFLVSQDRVPEVWMAFRGHAMSKDWVTSDDKRGSGEVDVTLASALVDRGMRNRYSN